MEPGGSIEQQKDAVISYDVAVAGGGIVGGTLACLLGGVGLDICAIDRASETTRLDPAFDGRTTAISFGSRNILEAAGLWAVLEPHASPIEQIRIADGASPLFLHFDYEAVEQRPFGWIVENRLIRKALSDRLRELPSVRVINEAAVTGYKAQAGRATLSLHDGRQIVAPLVAAADGRGSTLRDLSGIGTRITDYKQTALVFIMIHAEPHGQVAVEHFQPAGPLAILPMVDDASGLHRSSVVWTVGRDDAPALLAMDDAAFERELDSTLGDYWGRTRLAGRRFSYPLVLMQASRYTDVRLALVGEAAHAIHPIAGQGLNLGLRDAALLAELVADRARLGLDTGASSLLERYEARRRGDTMRLTLATDLLNRLFSNSVVPVRLTRDIGLAAVQKLPFLKKFFMLTAMGVAGNPPRLVKGERL